MIYWIRRFRRSMPLLILLTGCPDNGGTPPPPPPDPAITGHTAAPGRDSVVVSVYLNTAAPLTVNVRPAGGGTTLSANSATNTSHRLVVRDLAYATPYVYDVAAHFPQQLTATGSFTSGEPPNPCQGEVTYDRVDLKFEYRPAVFDPFVSLQVYDGWNCDNSTFITYRESAGPIYSRDGASFSMAFKARPNRPHGNKPLRFRIAVIKHGLFVRWLDPAEITFNGVALVTSVTETTPTGCLPEAQCQEPSLAATFNLAADGTVTP